MAVTVYATYSFYTTTYLGTAIASADFSRLILPASKEIDRLTYGRAAAVIAADTDDATIELIGLAACAVAEVIQKLDESGGAVQSESVGRASVSYFAPKTRESQVYDAARLYLTGTDLLYRGFTSTERGD